jgi:hypothetical protein
LHPIPLPFEGGSKKQRNQAHAWRNGKLGYENMRWSTTTVTKEGKTKERGEIKQRSPKGIRIASDKFR